VGEKAFELTVQLSSQGFVVAQHEGRFIDGLNHVGDGKGLARSGYTQQSLVRYTGLDAFYQLLDGFRLISRRFVGRGQLKSVALHESGTLRRAEK